MHGPRDADLRERAIGNLLDNAVKWSPPGGNIDLRVSDGEVLASDEGPGIAPADVSFAFDRFHWPLAARAVPRPLRGSSGEGGQAHLACSPIIAAKRSVIVRGSAVWRLLRMMTSA